MLRNQTIRWDAVSVSPSLRVGVSTQIKLTTFGQNMPKFVPMFSVYVHFPFCAQVCSYCDFAVLQGSGRLQEQFAALLLQETHLRWPRDAAKQAPRTMYWGGGTPTELQPQRMVHLGEEFKRLGILQEDLAEFTVESNPESTTEEHIQALHGLGVDRWSLGIQTFEARLLRQLGRRASPEQNRQALQRLLATGKRLSVDLMFSLPGQSPEGFLRDLQEAVDAGVSHVSFYGLEIHSNTLLGQQVRKGRIVAPDDQYAQFYRSGVALLESQGIVRYEVSNFAKVGQESLHNRNYWERGEYLGLGPGAHSFLKGVRWAAPRRFMEWGRWVEAGCPLADMEKDPIGSREALMELVWLGLRQQNGFEINSIQNQFGDALDWSAVHRFEEQGWLMQEHGFLRLVGEGWIYMDQVVSRILKD